MYFYTMKFIHVRIYMWARLLNVKGVQKFFILFSDNVKGYIISLNIPSKLNLKFGIRQIESSNHITHFELVLPRSI